MSVVLPAPSRPSTVISTRRQSDNVPPNAVVLVEGVSDQLAVEALAARRGRDLTAEGVAGVPIGGAGNIRRFLEQLIPQGIRVAGSVRRRRGGRLSARRPRLGSSALRLRRRPRGRADPLPRRRPRRADHRGPEGELGRFRDLPEPARAARRRGHRGAAARASWATRGGRKTPVRGRDRSSARLDLARVPRPARWRTARGVWRPNRQIDQVEPRVRRRRVQPGDGVQWRVRARIGADVAAVLGAGERHHAAGVRRPRHAGREPARRSGRNRTRRRSRPT